MCANSRHLAQKGISLVELIMFIVIVSVGLTGILSVMNQTTAHSADPLVRKQALAAAESLLEEVQLQDFVDRNDGVTTICPPGNAVTVANRAGTYHIVNCYNGFSMPAGITDLNGAPTGLGAYAAIVTVTPEALGGIAVVNAMRITVTVTDPQGNTVDVDGYRTRY